MHLSYRAWPVDPHISQTPSVISRGYETPKALSRNSVDTSLLTKAFPMPCSAHGRLLIMRNEMARRFYEIEALRLVVRATQLADQHPVVPVTQ